MLAGSTVRWWQQHDPRTGPAPRGPIADDRPALSVGHLVRIGARPERTRRVLEVRWHAHRHCYVYVVETSAGTHVPYWFAEQLVGA